MKYDILVCFQYLIGFDWKEVQHVTDQLSICELAYLHINRILLQSQAHSLTLSQTLHAGAAKSFRGITAYSLILPI